MSTLGLEAQTPMPFFATPDRRERYVAIKGISSVRRIGPRYFVGEVPHNFPMGKKNLHLRGIGKFEWT